MPRPVRLQSHYSSKYLLRASNTLLYSGRQRVFSYKYGVTCFTPIHFPVFNYTNTDQLTYVRYTSPFQFFKLAGLGLLMFDLQILEARISPKYRLEIHKDLDSNLNPGAAWSLVCIPTATKGCFVETYQQKPSSQLLFFNSVSKFQLPYLDESSAILQEEWNLDQGACIFNPGTEWHSVRNDTDNYASVFSLRSSRLDSLSKLKSLLGKK